MCSGNEVDAAYLRSSPLVQAQIKHHTSLSPTRNFEALRAGLEAAARCEIPENDVYRFGPIVENKARFQATVAFLKDRAPQIEAQAELVATSDPAAARYTVGERIFHQKFGYGRIKLIDGNKLTVEFEKAGIKKVIDTFVERH